MTTARTRNDFGTAADHAYDVISRKILSGDLQPGTRLSRRQMAAMAEVSVIPVTEAVRRLESDGLVESRPHWGTRVVALTEEKTRDLYALREAVECQVARMLAGDLSPAQVEELRAIAAELDATPHRAETDPQLWTLHHRLHIVMAQYTGCDSLKDALERVNLYRLLQNAVSRRTARQRPLPDDWHRQLVADIAEGTPDSAEAAMRQHVRDSLRTDDTDGG